MSWRGVVRGSEGCGEAVVRRVVRGARLERGGQARGERRGARGAAGAEGGWEGCRLWGRAACRLT